MTKFKNLRDLMMEQLQDLHSAEVQIRSALPEMIRSVTSAELRAALSDHLRKTEAHINRLESVGNRLGVTFDDQPCAGMQKIIQEGKQMLNQQSPSEVRDAGLIAAAQQIAHYEIAGYGTICAYAEQIGDTDMTDLLDKSLREEKLADKRLTLIGENSVNIWATAGYMAWEAAGLTKPETRKNGGGTINAG